MNWNNKICLISGASSGIGLELTNQLSNLGAIVYAGYRKSSDAEHLDSLNQDKQRQGMIHPILLDVLDPAHTLEASHHIQQNHEGLDLLINNAGIAVAGPLEAIPDEVFERQWRINLESAWRLTRDTLPLLKKNHGRVVMMSSVSGLVTFPMLGAYCISKHAMESMADAFRVELAHADIKVILIEPGPIATPIWQRSAQMIQDTMELADPDRLQPYQHIIDNFADRIEASEASGVPVDIAVQKMVKWISKNNPRARYLLSKTPWQIRLFQYMPTRLRDGLCKKYMKE